MVTVRVDGYLDQSKLESALKTIVGDSAWRGREVRLEAGRQRWDMVLEIDGRPVAVEFDGDEHYRHSLKIKADRAKDRAASEGGYVVVRIPYWVQLTTETLRHYLGLDAVIDQDFPHGFISTKLFPASFCELGVARFRRELEDLPEGVRKAVVSSLRDRIAEHGREYVVPTSLCELVERP